MMSTSNLRSAKEYMSTAHRLAHCLNLPYSFLVIAMVRYTEIFLPELLFFLFLVFEFIKQLKHWSSETLVPINE